MIISLFERGTSQLEDNSTYNVRCFPFALLSELPLLRNFSSDSCMANDN